MATTYYFLPTRNLFGEDSVQEAGTLMHMEKKPSPCFSGTNFSAASIPFWNRRC